MPFTEAMVGGAGTLNPLYAEEDNAREIDALIYQGLTETGPDQQPKPLLARQLQVSPDGLTYTALLRSDVLWPDGTPFTAADVAFTYSALEDPSYTGPDAANWKGVTVKAVAADRVDFVLHSPSAGFAGSLRVGILEKRLFSGADAPALTTSPYSGERAQGTGPFLVDSIAGDRRTVRLRRNPNARPQPKLDSIVFRGYPSLAAATAAVGRGEADAIGGLPAPEITALAHDPAVRVYEAGTFNYAAVLFDESAGSPFASVGVRRAFSQAIDRKALVSDVLSGHADVQNTDEPASDWAYSRDAAGRYPYDLAAAGKALDDAGWTLGPQALVRSRGDAELAVSLVAADAYPFREVAQELRRQLARIGARVDVQLVPAADLVSRHLATRSYQMAIASFDNGPDPDQFVFWHSSNRSYPLNFSTLPKQSSIDNDLDEGRATVDRAGRLAAYADLQVLLGDAAPAAFLYEPHYLYAVSRRFTGVHLDAAIEPGDRFEYVTDWQLAG